MTVATAFQNDPSLRYGSFRTNLHATLSTTLAVPLDLVGGVYNTSAATLAANSAARRMSDVSLGGFTLGATTTAARTLTFYAKKGDETTYDADPYVLNIPSGAAAGTYYPIGDSDGAAFGARVNEPAGGFAFVTSHAEVVGTIWWRNVGSHM